MCNALETLPWVEKGTTKTIAIREAVGEVVVGLKEKDRFDLPAAQKALNEAGFRGAKVKPEAP